MVRHARHIRQACLAMLPSCFVVGCGPATALAKGASGFLAKPYRPAEVVEADASMASRAADTA